MLCGPDRGKRCDRERGSVWMEHFSEGPNVEIKGWLLLFFFQAEDGIRDYKVTGVQTCALPIYRPAREGVFVRVQVIGALALVVPRRAVRLGGLDLEPHVDGHGHAVEARSDVGDGGWDLDPHGSGDLG